MICDYLERQVLWHGGRWCVPPELATVRDELVLLDYDLMRRADSGLPALIRAGDEFLLDGRPFVALGFDIASLAWYACRSGRAVLRWRLLFWLSDLEQGAAERIVRTLEWLRLFDSRRDRDIGRVFDWTYFGRCLLRAWGRRLGVVRG